MAVRCSICGELLLKVYPWADITVDSVAAKNAKCVKCLHKEQVKK